WSADYVEREGKGPRPLPARLLDEPGVEALAQLVALVAPEFGVDDQRILHVVRRRRQVRQHRRIDVRDRVLVRRTVRDVLGLVRHLVGLARVRNELVGQIEPRTALRHDPIVEIEALVVPNDLEVLALFLDGVEDTPVPRRGDHDLSVREQLRRLRARLPPDDVLLYRVELRERAVHTFWRT